MAYKLKFLNAVSDDDISKIKAMKIPNTDDETNESLWIENARKRIDKDLKVLDDAIEVFLGR